MFGYINASVNKPVPIFFALFSMQESLTNLFSIENALLLWIVRLIPPGDAVLFVRWNE